MTAYKVTLYDPQTKRTATLAEIPERRTDSKRPKGKKTVINWLKHTYGKEWYLQNKTL